MEFGATFAGSEGGGMKGMDELNKLTSETELFWVTLIVGGAVLMAFVAGAVVGAMMA